MATNDIIVLKKESGGDWVEFNLTAEADKLLGFNSSLVPAMLTTPIISVIKPATDSTTAVKITKADGTTSVITIDTTNGNVGIGTTAPNANALLDVTSTTKAFMPPRMTTTQRDAIPSPTEGMVIFNITTHVLDSYNGTAWNQSLSYTMAAHDALRAFDPATSTLDDAFKLLMTLIDDLKEREII